jgi:His/Glu/Gln/Arg/opine family amino acid ABC transporter permease subunit
MNDYGDLLFRSLPLLIKGAWMTIKVLIGASFVSGILGLAAGIVLCRRLRDRFVAPIIEAIAFVYRAVPFFIQLLIVYFVLPDLLGFNLAPFPASIIALGLCSFGYVTQIICTSIDTLPISHWESAFLLGYNKHQTLVHVILPQALRNAIPLLCNELESLLKSTAIVSSIGMLELTRAGMNIVSREMEPVPIYLTVAFFYLFMTATLNIASKAIERRFRLC